MHLPTAWRLALVGGVASIFGLAACGSAPVIDDDPAEASESALGACTPGTVDYTTAGCAQRNAQRARTCNASSRFGAFGACVCTPSSCAGRVCGDDGCGGSCGTCSGFERCNATGTACVAAPSGSSSGGGSSGGGASSGGSSGGPVCTAVAGGCAIDGQCCSGSCYAATSTCVACKPNTTLAYCSKDSQCCSGLCDTWTLTCVGVCKHKTSACTSNGQCCSGSCSSGSCL